MRTKTTARRSAGAGESKEINMIEIRYLQAESGANKFGTCNCCGKSSSEDPLMISVKFNYCGHGMTICLCDDCKKKLMEALLPANNSEIPNSSDTISRAKAIDALRKMQTYKLFSGDDMLLIDQAGAQTELMLLPPAQPERIKGHWIEIALSNHTYKCSVCGRLLVNITDGKNNVTKNYPYCHCGADMREVTS